MTVHNISSYIRIKTASFRTFSWSNDIYYLQQCSPNWIPSSLLQLTFHWTLIFVSSNHLLYLSSISPTSFSLAFFLFILCSSWWSDDVSIVLQSDWSVNILAHGTKIEYAFHQTLYSSFPSCDKEAGHETMAIPSFLEDKDVFVSLPTGYGKSLCFAALPYTFDQLRMTDRPSVVIVVSPLIALVLY